MFALISPLDPEMKLLVMGLREHILSNCQNLPVPVSFEPHITWHTASHYDLPSVNKVIEDLANSINQFRIATAGIGMFSGTRPVLYLNVIKTLGLIHLQQKIWDALGPFSKEPNPYFHVDKWIPHISIFYGDDRSSDALVCSVGDLVQRDLKFEIVIDRFQIVFSEDGVEGIHSEHSIPKTESGLPQ